jgi:hypothetical protein
MEMFEETKTLDDLVMELAKAEGRQQGMREVWRYVVFPILFSLRQADFGPIPEEIRLHAEQIQEIAELMEFTKRFVSAKSLSEIRLDYRRPVASSEEDEA